MNQRLPEPVQPVATAPLTETQRFWFAHVERCHESGLSIAAYARQHLLADKSLYHWVKRKREWPVVSVKAETAVFHRVQYPEPVSHSSGILSVELRFPNGIECKLKALEVGSCLEVLTGLSRLPA
jgi:hypothetical protein